MIEDLARLPELMAASFQVDARDLGIGSRFSYIDRFIDLVNGMSKQASSGSLGFRRKDIINPDSPNSIIF